MILMNNVTVAHNGKGSTKLDNSSSTHQIASAKTSLSEKKIYFAKFLLS